MNNTHNGRDKKPGNPHTGTPENVLRSSTVYLCIAGIAAAVIAVPWIRFFITSPASSASPQTVIFTVRSGDTLSTIVHHLSDQKLISSPTLFKLYARIKNSATRIKAGEYEMDTGMNPKTILELLTSGKSKIYRFTVPEGLNMEEIAMRAQKAGLCTKQQFLSLCNDLELINQLELPGMSLEGYLYPDTYFFSRETDCTTLIKRMVATFNKKFKTKWKARAKSLGLTVHDIVILASIIEKETGNAKERPIISSVFHNRLNQNMRLESDPTVIYGVASFDGKIRYKDLRRVTPYNTYQINGLPVGPIASPGAKSLQAALYPARTDYLFFVSKNDTTHQFSSNLEDHNKAVKKYQLNQ